MLQVVLMQMILYSLLVLIMTCKLCSVCSLYLSIQTVVLGGLGYRLTANSVQKFAKKYLKLGGDVTFQAASFSQLTGVNVKNATQINGFCQFFDFFRFFRENRYFLSGDHENSTIQFSASRSINWYLWCFRANQSVQSLSKNRDFRRFPVSPTRVVGPTRVRCHSIRLSKTNQMV